mmetsp:Transcript_48649/g.104190  ORF Transcript_48649/g.104190 Transcript_48649/m.104190 type:complete len:144 (-) Transcript_48649:157-588(-)
MAPLTAAILGATQRKALFLALAQVCVVAHFPCLALSGVGMGFAWPAAGSFVHNTIDPVIMWVFKKAKSTVLLGIVGTAVAATLTRQAMMLELLLMPEVELLAVPFFWAIFWPLGGALSFLMGLRVFVQNAGAIPESTPKKAAD